MFTFKFFFARNLHDFLCECGCFSCLSWEGGRAAPLAHHNPRSTATSNAHVVSLDKQRRHLARIMQARQHKQKARDALATRH